jgi:alpha-glucoside transport system permease protein
VRHAVPLALPAIAAFAIFQFLWVCNDLLVAIVFPSGNANTQVVT